MDADPIAKRLAALSPAKRALFELRLKQRAAADSVDQTIPRRPPSASAPLSFAQQRLWFLNQLDPASPAYNEPRAIRLKGVLDINALQQALNQIVARHEVLRTTFVTVDGAPMQLIAEHRELDLSIVDLSASPGSTRESQIHDLLADEARRPFDLSRDLMLRALILRLEEREHIALLVTPHIASDGWSSGVLWREVSAIYGALVSGQPSALADLPIQYADYAIWQRHWLQGKVLDRQLTYWKKQLDGVSPFYLPADRARPALQTYRGEKQSLMLSEKLSDQLRALSRQHDVTLFMTVLGAFHVLLYRYSGQADIAVGTPFAGRTRAETESLIGFFVNTLVMRSNLSGNPSFREMLDRVREVTLGAHAHQDVPFEKLVQELNPERNLTTSPLFQVAFALQNVPKTVAELPGLDMIPVDVESGIAKFDLYVGITDQGHELTARAVYNTDLFNHLTIDRMLRHFQALLQSIVADPEQRILDLPMLTSAEKHRLLFDSNGAESDYPKNKCIHELFEAQVEKSPNAVAVTSEDLQLTYRELNRRANQLAHFLRKLGIGPEILVGICLERSVEMIVGLLGILKAGAAYVPLDPDYPKERLEFMLGDAQAPVVLSEESLIESLPSQSARVVCLDKDWELIVQESPDNLTSETTADNLAYVIYTSGSTGRPKGVAVAHRAINRLVIHTDYVELTSADVMAQASNASFDAATFEIWGALLHGARLVIISTEVMLSPRALASAIERYGITVLFLTTALFNQLIERIPSALAKLSHLLFGGEAADPLRVRELLRHGPPKRLLHVYGPTETTTFASSYLIENVRDGEVTVPIGRPIANTQIYVLDPRLSPAPIGIPGEIYIGGDGAARGYLNCPEVTAEKFIADPFSEKPGTRLYKTGDLARYLSDGNIEFLGRIDDQVKIRGYRIEPGEVESALIRHPAIHEAVVLAQEEGDASASLKADRRLVAYAVVNQRPGPSTNELRSFLQLKLPEYMVPSAFVFLDSLPLTPNGK
jgi:amino acid adenylation domain-containing protein